jgi:hypothetical protein
MLIMLIINVLIFSQKKAQSVEYGFFICISEKINTGFLGDVVLVFCVGKVCKINYHYLA